MFWSTVHEYTPRLHRVLSRLDALVDWERRARSGPVGSARLMRVSSAPSAELLQRLSSPHKRFTPVHITGSKGKGTVAALIAAGLGPSVGVFSSPHVERINERVLVRGAPVSDDMLADSISNALDARERHPKISTATWFDVVTAAAFSIFAEERLDRAVVEVGMGGRFDSTNVLNAPVSVITNIALEHAAIIGPTVEDIAREKAGIIAPGAHVILGMARDNPLAPIFEEEAQTVEPKATVTFVARKATDTLRAHNVALARAALSVLHEGLSDERAENALSMLPARQEPFVLTLNGAEVPVVLDGAHVPNSVQAVISELQSTALVIVLGVGREKDVLGICGKIVAAQPVHVFATATGTESPYLPANELADALRKAGVRSESMQVVQDAPTALSRAVELASNLRASVLIIGSLHLAGRLRPILRLKQRRAYRNEASSV